MYRYCLPESQVSRNQTESDSMSSVARFESVARYEARIGNNHYTTESKAVKAHNLTNTVSKYEKAIKIFSRKNQSKSDGFMHQESRSNHSVASSLSKLSSNVSSLSVTSIPISFTSFNTLSSSFTVLYFPFFPLKPYCNPN